MWPLPTTPEGKAEFRRRLFGLDHHHGAVANMESWGEWFVRRAITGRRPWLIIEGNPGCGKTHVAKRCARFVKDYAFDAYASFWGSRGRLPSVEFRDWPKLVESKEPDYEDGIADLYAADVVILDDVGAEADPYKSGLPLSRLRSLLSRLEGKAVLITTNVRASDWAARDERIASRLTMASRFNGFSIPDYRPKKASREAGRGRPDVFTPGQSTHSGRKIATA